MEETEDRPVDTGNPASDAAGAPSAEDLDAAAAEQQAKEATAEPPGKIQPYHPMCPHCGCDPLVFKARIFRVGNAVVLITWCKICRKPVPAALVDMIQAAPPKRIEIPRGMVPAGILPTGGKIIP